MKGGESLVRGFGGREIPASERRSDSLRTPRVVQSARDYEKVERVIDFLHTQFRRQPALAEIAAHVGLSEFHFQRLFARWVGISPKRFLQYLTKEHALHVLDQSQSVLDAAYDAGLSGPGRLHDLLVSCEAATPGELRLRGEGLRIAYGFHPSPFGQSLIAATARGICQLSFVSDGDQQEPLRRLRQRWGRATLIHNPQETQSLAERVFTFPSQHAQAPLHLYVRGTNFQIQVWQALLRIPLGQLVSYEDLARHVGLPKAARAVGNAVGANPIPFLIPCHRVIRKVGDPGNYGEGPLRKQAILGWEAARRELDGETAASADAS
jgi:AraC family transcriptional regulator, regulatory protein of adaptative response / methylated-DNA-[protein]-cysteine methyltransferase